MPIDFQAPHNRESYTGREASPDWRAAMRGIVDPAGLRVADIGCGGGIYTRAWAELGAAQVTGVDFSEEQLAAARASSDDPRLSFRHGTALATGLPKQSVDLVFERALLHHGIDRLAAVRESGRVLAPGGRLIIQDRTMADIALPGSPQHLRGYLFARFPRLLAIEAARRPAPGELEAALGEAGFAAIGTGTLWETRRRYPSFDDLAAELRARSGRSILHELSDDELAELIAFLRQRLPQSEPLIDRDRWTIWSGRR